MSIGMLAASESTNNALAVRGAKKAAQDGDASPSGFKDLVGDRKGDQKTTADTATNPGEESSPVWRQFGFRFGQGNADDGTLQVESDEMGAPIEPGDAEGDTQPADAVAAVTVDAAIVVTTEPVLPAKGPGAEAGALQTAEPAKQIKADVEAAVAEPVDTAAKVDEIVEKVAATAATPAAAQAAVTKPEGAQDKSTVRGVMANQTQTAAHAATLQRPEADADVSGNGAESGRQDQGRAYKGDVAPQNTVQVAGATPTPNVSVLSSQVATAPVQPMPISETGKAFATSLAAGVLPDDGANATTQTTLPQHFGKAAPITTLKIQLHPAELGVVTARLSGSESQLSIAITVDNAEARHRLTTDADAIVSALKGMGIDIDRVTIQQQQPGSGSSANGDGRGSEFRQSGDSRSDGQGQSSRQGSGSNNGENHQRSASVERPDAAGGGVYI